LRVVLVFDHPYGAGASENVPHHRSFTAALAAAAVRGMERAGHEVDLIDLATDGFDPMMSAADLAACRSGRIIDPLAADYQRRVMCADHLVFAFPVWWEAMPAGTKGFLDKVLTKGIVFSEAKRLRPFENHLQNLRGVTLITTMSTPGLIYRWFFGAPVTKILFRGTFMKIGVRNLRWLNYAAPDGRSEAQRRVLLSALERRFAGH